MLSWSMSTGGPVGKRSVPSEIIFVRRSIRALEGEVSNMLLLKQEEAEEVRGSLAAQFNHRAKRGAPSCDRPKGPPGQPGFPVS